MEKGKELEHRLCLPPLWTRSGATIRRKMEEDLRGVGGNRLQSSSDDAQQLQLTGAGHSYISGICTSHRSLTWSRRRSSVNRQLSVTSMMQWTAPSLNELNLLIIEFWHKRPHVVAI